MSRLSMFHVLVGCLALPCFAEDQSMSQKYMDHIKSIQEIMAVEYNRCLQATDIANCAPSKEFQNLVNSMMQDMVKNSEQMPEKYYESLMQGATPGAIEELLRKHREGLNKETLPSRKNETQTKETI